MAKCKWEFKLLIWSFSQERERLAPRNFCRRVIKGFHGNALSVIHILYEFLHFFVFFFSGCHPAPTYFYFCGYPDTVLLSTVCEFQPTLTHTQNLRSSRKEWTSVNTCQRVRLVGGNWCPTPSPTGWSLKTVNCNFFLTDPKISRSAITQWFLESLYREVLVFWCFKIVRCGNFAFWSFSNKEHLLHHSRPYHS